MTLAALFLKITKICESARSETVVTQGVTEEEEAEFIRIANKAGPVMTYPFFAAGARLFALTAIEPIVLRERNDNIEVLLIWREAEGETIPELRNTWHSPGTMLRASDQSYDDAFRRLERNELHTSYLGTPEFAGVDFHHYERGGENGLVFVAAIAEEDPPAGTFIRVDGLPPNLIRHHHNLIRIAVEHFRKKK